MSIGPASSTIQLIVSCQGFMQVQLAGFVLGTSGAPHRESVQPKDGQRRERGRGATVTEMTDVHSPSWQSMNMREMYFTPSEELKPTMSASCQPLRTRAQSPPLVSPQQNYA